MFQHIYIEEKLQSHPNVQAIVERFPEAGIILCNRYQEIFNRKNQNFRLQKQKPALILAKKFQHLVLPIPSGYGIGSKHNFYFSHMLNCIYDCRYCFLQGMYASANYVLFVNYEDFQQEMIKKMDTAPTESFTFFSGYDCDSLALEHITHFVKYFLPFFQKHPQASLELRTKSINTTFLQKYSPLINCIVAFTLTPQPMIDAYEHNTPSLKKRMQALVTLQQKGWSIGLRFDPLLFSPNFTSVYSSFFQEVFSSIDPKKIHSVTLGVFRLPKPFYKKMSTLYPEETLFAQASIEQEGLVSYQERLREDRKSVV